MDYTCILCDHYWKIPERWNGRRIYYRQGYDFVRRIIDSIEYIEGRAVPFTAFFHYTKNLLQEEMYDTYRKPSKCPFFTLDHRFSSLVEHYELTVPCGELLL